MSYLRLAVGVGLCLAVGYFLTDMILVQIRTRTWLKAWLAIGIGFGATSFTYFTWRLASVDKELVFFLVELALAGGLGIGWYLVKHRVPTTVVLVAPSTQTRLSAGWPMLLYVCFVLAILSAGLNYFFGTLIRPHGGWDAWAIWNLAARFLFAGTFDWKNLFDSALFHPDYPLLLGSSVARLWNYRSVVDIVSPALVGLLFSLATVGLLITLANLNRGGVSGSLAGLALLGSSTLLINAPTQCADLILGYYLLGALGCLSIYQKYPISGLLIMTGILLGLGAWTKNEGWLLIIAVLLGWGISLLFFDNKPFSAKDRLRKVAWLLTGLIPVLVFPLIQKWFLAPANDLVALQSGQTLSRMSDPVRWIEIGQRFANAMISLGGKNSAPLGILLILVIIFGVKAKAFSRAEVWINLITLMAAIAGYFLVYLVTPHDLDWHLRTSLNRLFAQLWPAAVFTMVLIIKLPCDSNIEES